MSATFRDLDALIRTGRKFGAILADPPWSFATYSDKGKGRSAERHYSCMSLDDIKRLPIAELAAPDCVLFLWGISTMVPETLDVIRAWGFTFKTKAFNWVKSTKHGKCIGAWGFGRGQTPRMFGSPPEEPQSGSLKVCIRSSPRRSASTR